MKHASDKQWLALEAQRLAVLGRYRILDTPPEDAFDRITRLASSIFDVPIALVNLIDEDRQWFKSCCGLDICETAREVSFCSHAIQADDVMTVPDATLDARFCHNPLVTGEPGIRYYAGAPLKTADGFNLGTLCILDTKRRPRLGEKQQMVLRDMASMVMAEFELRRETARAQDAEAKFRRLVEQTSDWVWEVDADGRFTYASPRATIMLGFESNAFIGKAPFDFMTPAEAQRLKRDLAPYLASPRSFRQLEMKLVHKDGREVILESSGTPILDEQQLKGYHGIARDITKRKHAEQAFEAANSLLRATFDATADGVLSVDLTGKVTGYNQRYLSMWRVPKEVIISGDDASLLQHARAQLKDSEGFLTRVASIYDDLEGETRDVIALIDGRFLERRSLPQRVGDRIVGRVWSFRDVTKQKHAEARLQQFNTALDDRVKARTRQLERANAELERANAQLHHDAFHDSLTGLPNRALLIDRLGRAIERSQRHPERAFAVLYLDCDRFKNVNDGLGHAAGDELLVEVATRLRAFIRAADTVARQSGDEFILLLEDVRLEGALETAERIQQELMKPFAIQERMVYLSVSTGIVMAESSYDEAEAMLRDAEIAMYRAKALGKAGHQVFAEEMRQRAVSVMTLENDLRNALKREELEVHYQPIVAIETERTVGFEALVRWRHPKHGMISPAEFIPIAEETGLIVEIDRWVLKEACRQVRRWQAEVSSDGPLTLSVNLSGQELAQSGVGESVASILQETGFCPNHLRLELTESVLVQHADAALETLQTLRALGVQLSLDDFGTGYSSLGYLQRFPLDTLKIDRMFVANMSRNAESAELVRTIVRMAQNLGLRLVAEGIETSEQARQLKALKCQYGQGYLFSKPLPPQVVPAFLEAHNIDPLPNQ